MICPKCGKGEVVQTYHDIEVDNYKCSNGYDYYRGKVTITVPKDNHFHCDQCGEKFIKQNMLVWER